MNIEKKVFINGIVGGASLTIMISSLAKSIKATIKYFKSL